MLFLDDILESTAGQIHGEAHSGEFLSFCFDSRIAEPQQMFVAIKTERNDGHRFIQHACERGVTGVLCESPPVEIEGKEVTNVIVPDCKRAMQQWAQYLILKQEVDVVGVTGSVGKTTTKEAVAAVLDTSFNIFKNHGNYNSVFGLPIALSEISPHQRLAVLELGTAAAGEISRLSEIVQPRVGIVTAVAPTHLEKFRTLDAIESEKGDLVASLPMDGIAILNADDERVLRMAHRTTAKVMTYGTGVISEMGAFPDVYASDISMSWEGLEFTVETPVGRHRFHSPLIGFHQVESALAAIAVGLVYNLDVFTIASGLAEIKRIPGRLFPLLGKMASRLLDDTYSSSPVAMNAALDALDALSGRKKVAVLGDMLELGGFETAAHENVGRKVASIADFLVTKGNRAIAIADSARQAGMSDDQIYVTHTSEDAARIVLELLVPGDVVLIKGSHATRMEQVTQLLMHEPDLAGRQLVRQDAAWQEIVVVAPDRPTWLEIDLGAIAHNTRSLKGMVGSAAVLISLKADAYGHGALHVGRTALLNGATWLGVACLKEGVILRQGGIVAPILILGHTPGWQALDLVQHNLTATVFDINNAQALSQAAITLNKKAHVHVKVDTGMGRLGISPSNAVGFIQRLFTLENILVEGIFTHLSVADGITPWELEYSQDQLDTFKHLLLLLEEAGLSIPIVHFANSAVLLNRQIHPADKANAESSTAVYRNYQLDYANLVRTGIAIYGLDPSTNVRCPDDFRAALTWKTQIAQVKDLPPNSHIGYGATYRTNGYERIAIIPVGYGDGFRRAPRHWGEVLVRGQRVPIIGRVCMDQTILNATMVPDIRQGDEVVLIGSQNSQIISAEDVAARLGTSNYEVVAGILPRVPRETIG